MKTTLNPERVTQEILKGLTDKHVRATEELKEAVRGFTPEDTGLMDISYRVRGPEKQKHSITTKIENVAKNEKGFEYPIVVEYGRGNVMFRYQKPKGHMFYAGVGAHPMGRAIEAFKKLFLYLLKE